MRLREQVKEALGRGPTNSSWDHDGPCDGTLTLTDGAGSGPFIMYGAPTLLPAATAGGCCGHCGGHWWTAEEAQSQPARRVEGGSAARDPPRHRDGRRTGDCF